MKDAIGVTALSSGKEFNVSSYQTYDNKRVFFSRASFDFLNRYVVALSFRRDGYSNFFPQNKYANFPSVSLAWKISNESFLKNVKAIGLLKLRGSYGLVGSLDYATLAYGTFIPDPSVTSFNNGATNYTPYYQNALDHSNLQWPKTIMKNIGLDFSLFNDRVSGAIDWFRDDLTRILKTDNNFLEGQRKMDLVRNGKWQSALIAVGKTLPPVASDFLFPIPQYALDAGKGKLTQTPGYQ